MIKRPWLFLVLNVATASYFLLLLNLDSKSTAGSASNIKELNQWARIPGELLTIPFLIVLIAGVYFSVKNLVMNRYSQKWVIWVAFLIGSVTLVLLILRTISDV